MKVKWTKIVDTFSSVNSDKISVVTFLIKYHSKVTAESSDVMANFVASSVNWCKVYGTLRPRGNVGLKTKAMAKQQQVPTMKALEELIDISSSEDDDEEEECSEYEKITDENFNPSDRTLRKHTPVKEFQGQGNLKRTSIEDPIMDEFYENVPQSNPTKILKKNIDHEKIMDKSGMTLVPDEAPPAWATAFMKQVVDKVNTLEEITDKIMKQDTTTKQESTNADDDKSSSH